jgi:hypothetical protein
MSIQPDPFQQLVSCRVRCLSVPPPAMSELGCNQHIVPYGKRPEGFQTLEGSGYSEARPLMGAEKSHIQPINQDPPGRRRLQSRYDIEQRGFSSTVGSYKPGNRALLKAEPYAL